MFYVKWCNFNIRWAHFIRSTFDLFFTKEAINTLLKFDGSAKNKLVSFCAEVWLARCHIIHPVWKIIGSLFWTMYLRELTTLSSIVLNRIVFIFRCHSCEKAELRLLSIVNFRLMANLWFSKKFWFISNIYWADVMLN